MSMRIAGDNNVTAVFDRHLTLRCPHCGALSGMTAISIPRYEYVTRFDLSRVGIVYKCDACAEPVFLRFGAQVQSGYVYFTDEYEEVERPQETFELSYLPGGVAADFAEALKCYSGSCHNAFAAMCRRTIQAAAMELGAEGSTKVQNQLGDLKAMGAIDDAAHEQLTAIMLTGHDGAHPHLPNVSPERASVLLEIMKDVLYQLFVRPAKIREAAALRRQAIGAREV